MANLTLTIDDDVLRRARAKALQHGTSVNALVRDYLRGLVGGADDSAMQAFLAEAEALRSGSGPDGRRWTREDLYDEQMSDPAV